MRFGVSFIKQARVITIFYLQCIQHIVISICLRLKASFIAEFCSIRKNASFWVQLQYFLQYCNVRLKSEASKEVNEASFWATYVYWTWTLFFFISFLKDKSWDIWIIFLLFLLDPYIHRNSMQSDYLHTMYWLYQSSNLELIQLKDFVITIWNCARTPFTQPNETSPNPTELWNIIEFGTFWIFAPFEVTRNLYDGLGEVRLWILRGYDENCKKSLGEPRVSTIGEVNV